MQHDIAILQKYAEDGIVYRAFDHAVIATIGMVVAVPLVHTSGVLVHLPDKSPIPWFELWAILDAEPDHEAMFDRDLTLPAIIQDLGLSEIRWHVAQLTEYHALVFICPETGLRLGISADYVYSINSKNSNTNHE